MSNPPPTAPPQPISSQLRHRHHQNLHPGTNGNPGYYVSQASTPVMSQHHRYHRSHTINLGSLVGGGGQGTRSDTSGISRLDEIMATLEAQVEEEDHNDEMSGVSSRN